MTEQIVNTENDKISALTDGRFSAQEVALVKSVIAKNVTNTELAFFLNTARTVDLNPFIKEIFCYKDNRNNLVIFAGRDAFLKKAQQSPYWNGIMSFAVFSNDKFEMKINGGVTIEHSPNFKDRGEIVGAYAIARPKGGDITTVEWADIKTYDKKQFTWNTHKEEMIKKVVESHCLKKAYGINGIQSEYDYHIENDVALPVESDKTELESLQDEVIDLLSKYNGADKEEIRETCNAARLNNQFSIEFAKKTIKVLKR